MEASVHKTGNPGRLRRDWSSRLPWWALRSGLWLGLAWMPWLYNWAMPRLSDGFSAPWFLKWLTISDGFAGIVASLLPGIPLGASRIYSAHPGLVRAYIHFASLDMVWVAVFTVASLALWKVPRLRPAADSGQMSCYRHIVSRQGEFFGAFLALAGVVLLPVMIYLYVNSFATNGSELSRAYMHCAEHDWPWWMRSRHCVRYVPNDFAGTLRDFGVVQSWAAASLPLGIWLTGVLALFPLWVTKVQGR